MYQIELLSDSPKQAFSIPIEGYSSARIDLEFKPNQEGWFLSLSWGTFLLKNERVSVSPNLLRQFQNLIPFGILVTGNDAIDPYTVDAWVNHCKMYILDETDITEVDAIYVQ